MCQHLHDKLKPSLTLHFNLGGLSVLQAALEQVSQLTAQATAASKHCSTLECQLQMASDAATAGQLASQQAAQQQQALQRRLERARQGGHKAVQAAASLSQQLQAAGEDSIACVFDTDFVLIMSCGAVLLRHSLIAPFIPY
jgi:hypothetical protein